MLVVSECVMLTPLGNVEQTVAGVAAGMNVYQQSIFLNRQNNPMTMCEVPSEAFVKLPEKIAALKLSHRRERVVKLAITGLSALFEQTSLSSKTPVLFCAPEKIPGTRTTIDDRYLELMLNEFPENVDQQNSFVFPFGRAAISHALDAAKEILNSGQYEAVIVGGADSFRDPLLLEILDLEGRVLAEGVPGGFAPGEASAFLVLQLADQNKTDKARIAAWASASEPGHRYSDENYLGEALAGAVQASLDSAPEKSIAGIYANLNGEQFFSKEWGIAQLRNNKWFAEQIDIFHPADCFGDLGAATGPVQIGLVANQQAERKNSIQLMCFSSDLDSRSALVMNGRGS